MTTAPIGTPDDTEDWGTALVEPFGEDVDFGTDNLGTFVGTYLSSKTISVPDEAARKRKDNPDPEAMRDQLVYEFADANGEKRVVWGSWAVDKAFEGDRVTVGQRVKFVGKGIAPAGVGTVKLYEIYAK